MNLNESAMPSELGVQVGGMTLRTYAAIHLCVPDSGNDELDAMIRRAQRERLAGMIVAGLAAEPTQTFSYKRATANWCYQVADAVIAAGEGSHER